jgi:hypothetical protein
MAAPAIKASKASAAAPPYPSTPIDKSKYPIFAVLDKIWKLYPNLRSDCSGYLKKVAQDLCVLLSTGTANDIVTALSINPAWTKLGNDAAKAATLAGQGYFVIAGKVDHPNGHVAIVVPGWSSSGYPMGYWGMLGGTGSANSSLTNAWMADAYWNSSTGKALHPHKAGAPSPLDQVLYFALPLQNLLKPVTK